MSEKGNFAAPCSKGDIRRRKAHPDNPKVAVIINYFFIVYFSIIFCI